MHKYSRARWRRTCPVVFWSDWLNVQMQNFYSTILCTSLNLFVSYYRNMRLNQNSVPNCLMWLLSSEVVYAVHFFSSKYKVLICPIYHTLCAVIWGCMSTAMEKYIKHFHTSSCVFHLRSNKRQEPRLSSSTLLMPLKEFLALVFILQYNQSYGWSCAVLCILMFMEVMKWGHF